MTYVAILLGIVLVLLFAERALHGPSRRAIPLMLGSGSGCRWL